jgi:hypothetical protein
MPERVTKSFSFDELRRANERSLRKPDHDRIPALPYYERHPEHRPRKQTRRLLRRRAIRGG